MIRLVLAVLLLALCGGEAHAAETPDAHGDCELRVAGVEVNGAQSPPPATSLWESIWATADVPPMALGSRRDVTRHPRAPDGQRPVVPLRSPPRA